jgi:uncharacterized protein (DUF983 family)
MFDRLMKFLGAACTAAGLSVQTMNAAADKPNMAMSVIGIACAAIAAGALASSTAVIGGKPKDQP